MNVQFQKLFNKLSQSECLILGLMSGTSADGLNIALCRFNQPESNDFLKVIHFDAIAYPLGFRELILEHRSKKQVDLASLCRLNVQVAQMHAQIVNQCLHQWKIERDEILAIASHGQTIYHAPSSDFNSTFQIGDGDHLAVRTGCLVWSDFRQKHVAHGGEGAPLARYFDEMCCHSYTENRVLLNLGGIANFTWLDANNSSRNFATDTGPANTLIDTYCRKYFQKSYDENGQIARSGNLHQPMLLRLLLHPYFSQKPPKTTGQELFNEVYVESVLSEFQRIRPEDVLCTLTHFTAKSLVDVFRYLPDLRFEIYASGGGIHNGFLMECIRNYSGKNIHNLEVLHISPDAKEAALFAFLAYNAMKGDAFVAPNGGQMYLGKLSFPL